MHGNMLLGVATLCGSTVRWFLRRISSRFRYLALWAVCRCLPKRPVYKLLAYAYAFSAIVQILSSIAICACLAFLIVAYYSNGYAAFGLLVVIMAGRFCFGIPVMAALLGGLTLLPYPQVNWLAVQLPLGLSIWLSGLAFLWEQRIRRSQFHFKPFYMSNINEGSAKILRDEVRVVHLFVDTKLKWSLDDRKVARSLASEALAWLTAQAARYEVPLRFKEHELWQSESWQHAIPDKSASRDDHQTFGNWLNRVLEPYTALFSTKQNTNCCLLVYVKEELAESWAYAVAKHRFWNQTCRLEYAVIGTPHDPSVIAHELLHLFGADDFYLAAYCGRNYDEPPFRSHLLDRCIMYVTKPTISSSLVDDLTAQNIGWL